MNHGTQTKRMHFLQKNTVIKIGCVVLVGSALSTLVCAQPAIVITPVSLVTSDRVLTNAAGIIQSGRNIFRYDTYGDEAFWGDALQLHQTIQGSRFGGAGPGVSPKTALALGLKVDSDALPPPVLRALVQGHDTCADASIVARRD